jgi:hypothetical protein
MMQRRVFLVKMAAISAGLMTLLKGKTVWSKGLPSDPGTAPAGAGGADLVSLPPFEKSSGFALEKALLERKSFRSYDAARKLSPEEVSKLLWATTGVNRTDNKRTVPSARASYPVEVFVALPEGVYLYEPKGHVLKKVIAEDIRSKIPSQDGFRSAAMIVLYVINKDKVLSGKTEWADLEIGCMGQSLFLEAVSLGLASCIFANFSAESVAKTVGLKDNQTLRIAQAVGGAK